MEEKKNAKINEKKKEDESKAQVMKVLKVKKEIYTILIKYYYYINFIK